jgi:hypothetical protein
MIVMSARLKVIVGLGRPGGGGGSSFTDGLLGGSLSQPKYENPAAITMKQNVIAIILARPRGYNTLVFGYGRPDGERIGEVWALAFFLSSAISFMTLKVLRRVCHTNNAEKTHIHVNQSSRLPSRILCPEIAELT